MRVIQAAVAALVLALAAPTTEAHAAAVSDLPSNSCSVPAKTVSDADVSATRGVDVVLPSDTVAVARARTIAVELTSGDQPLDEDVTLATPWDQSLVQVCSNGTWQNEPQKYVRNPPASHLSWQLGHVDVPAHKLVRLTLRYSAGPGTASRTLPVQPETRPFRARAGDVESGVRNLSVAGISVTNVTPSTGCAIDGTTVEQCDFQVTLHNYADEAAPGWVQSWAMHENCPDCPEIYDDETINSDHGGVVDFPIHVGTVPASSDLALRVHVVHLGRRTPALNGVAVIRPKAVLAISSSRYPVADYGQTMDVDYANAGTRTAGIDATGEHCSSPGKTESVAHEPGSSLHVDVPSGIRAAANSQLLTVRVRSGARALDAAVTLISPFGRAFSPRVQQCESGQWKDARAVGRFTKSDKFRLGPVQLAAHRVARFPVRFTMALPTRENSFPRPPLDFSFRARAGDLESGKAVMRVAGFGISDVTPHKGCAIDGRTVDECTVTVTVRNRSGEAAPLWWIRSAVHQNCATCDVISDRLVVRARRGHRWVTSHGGLLRVPGKSRLPIRLHVTMRGKDKGVFYGNVLFRPDFEHPDDVRGADYNVETLAKYNNGGVRTGGIDDD